MRLSIRENFSNQLWSLVSLLSSLFSNTQGNLTSAVSNEFTEVGHGNWRFSKHCLYQAWTRDQIAGGAEAPAPGAVKAELLTTSAHGNFDRRAGEPRVFVDVSY